MLDQATLLHLFRYEAETGRLYWRNPRASNKRPGDEAGCEFKNGATSYRIVNIAKQLYLTHRIVWVMAHGSLGDDELIDHRDRDGLNNKIGNLRLADRRLNAVNSKTRVDNTSGVRGVSFDRARDKWSARIVVKGRYVHLGRFDEFEAAIAARAAGEAKFACR